MLLVVLANRERWAISCSSTLCIVKLIFTIFMLMQHAVHSNICTSTVLKRPPRQVGLEHVQTSLGLIRRDHVAGVVYLQERETRGSSSLALTIVPVMRLGRIKLILVSPFQSQGPRSVAQIVADKVNIAGVDQGGITSVQQLGNVMAKVLHPICVELHIDSVIAGLPVVRVSLVNAQSFLGRFQVQKVSDKRKVVAKRGVLALFTNIVRVKSSGLVWRRQAHVAQYKGRLTGKVIERTISSVALMDECGALWHYRLHGFIRRFVDDLDVMRIVPDHLGIPLVLLLWVGEPVSNGQANEI